MRFETLIQQPESRRDAEWENLFLGTFPGIQVQVEKDEPVAGPDGFPYLVVRTGSGSEPAQRVLTWLAERGCGLVVNPHKMIPDYVFTFGAIWHWAQTGRFVPPSKVAAAPPPQPEPGTRWLMGPPTEGYLPARVREYLRLFLREKGATEPRILVVSDENFKIVDLHFSWKSLGSPDPARQKTIADGISWFLPPGYDFVIGDGQGLPEFHPL